MLVRSRLSRRPLSESSGAVENGVKLRTGLLCVHLTALERKIGGKTSTKHPVMTWLVERVADMMTKYQQGAHGRTAYERLLGQHVHEEGLKVCECAL